MVLYAIPHPITYILSAFELESKCELVRNLSHIAPSMPKIVIDFGHAFFFIKTQPFAFKFASSHVKYVFQYISYRD
jgi:hypothetical protein